MLSTKKQKLSEALHFRVRSPQAAKHLKQKLENKTKTTPESTSLRPSVKNVSKGKVYVASFLKDHPMPNRVFLSCPTALSVVASTVSSPRFLRLTGEGQLQHSGWLQTLKHW